MPLAPRTSALAGTSRFEFNYEEFRKQLQNTGYEVRWSKAMLCPNRNQSQDDHHVIGCPICNDTGFVYYDPIETRMLCTSFGLQQLFMPESRYNPGTTYFTSLPEHRMSFWDKIEMLKSHARFSQVLPVKAGVVQYRVKYDIVSVVQIITDAGALLDPDLYSVDTEGRLVFKTPPSFKFFAVSYTYRTTYIVTDMIHVIRDARQTEMGQDVLKDFPCQVSARLDFLVREESAQE